MRLRYLWIMGALAVGAACDPNPELYVPQGEPAAGRQVFDALQCHACHRVLAEDFPRPNVQPRVPVVLGDPMNKKSRAYLAESVLAPSHRFARPREEIIGLNVLQRTYENIEEDGQSRMLDYKDAMTVREWVDLVAYLDALQNRSRREIGL